MTCYTAIHVAFCFSTMNTTNICCLFYFILCRSICLSLSISNSFPVYVHAVFHFVPPLEIQNLYFGRPFRDNFRTCAETLPDGKSARFHCKVLFTLATLITLSVRERPFNLKGGLCFFPKKIF